MTYPGGKSGSGVYQTLINLMPPHLQYIEPFLGMGGVMRRKKPAFYSLGIDSDLLVTCEWTKHDVPGLTVDCGDGIRFLKTYPRLHSQTLVYCDPPYLPETCKSRMRYRDVMSTKDHERLLTVLLHLKCMVMISGYPSAMYDDALRSWRRVEFQAMTRGGSLATEVVWLNFPAPRELHDYQFLGKTFREREVIRRRIQRWTKRFSKMNEIESLAMFAALDAARSGIAGNGGARATPDVAMPPVESTERAMSAVTAGIGVAGSALARIAGPGDARSRGNEMPAPLVTTGDGRRYTGSHADH